MAGRFAAERPAGGLQMLAASSVGGVDAAVRHVLWYLVLQTSTDCCAQLVLHPLRNVQPVQLVVQEMAESAVVLSRVADICLHCGALTLLVGRQEGHPACKKT